MTARRVLLEKVDENETFNCFSSSPQYRLLPHYRFQEVKAKKQKNQTSRDEIANWQIELSECLLSLQAT